MEAQAASPEPFYMHRNIDTIPFDSARKDTLQLPEKKVTPGDSFSTEFKKYWTRVEKEDGFDKLRDQINARDIDKSWYPHFYLFDSNLVFIPFPPHFVIRKKHRK